MLNPMLYDLMAFPSLERWGSILMMLIFISVLIIAHEMGHFWVARRCGIKVERFGFGLPFGPTLWSKNIGGVEYCIHACLFGGYVSFPDDDPDNPLPKDAPERFENKPLWARFAVMIAGVTVNAILGWVILFFVFMAWGYPSGEAEKRVLIGGLTSQGAPAAQAGLKKGDELAALGGKAIAGKDYVEMVKSVQAEMKAHSQKPLALTILRNQKPLTLTVTPNEKGLIGIQLTAVQKYDPVQGPVDAAAKTTGFLSNVIGKHFEALGKLVTGQIAFKELAGPIRIVDEGANMIDQNGIQTGLMFTAVISIILAVMNLLPIPALDGGHIFFLLIEAIKGSPVKQEFRERVTQAGFLCLLGLIALILLNDIRNILVQPPKMP